MIDENRRQLFTHPATMLLTHVVFPLLNLCGVAYIFWITKEALDPTLHAKGVAALCAAGAALAIGVAPSDRMPQVAFGGDALSVAFGGAKTAISDAMFRRADSYFHGGVDMDCSCRHHHDGRDEHDLYSDDHDHEHHDHEHSEHGDGHDGHDRDSDDAWDPWAWINERIRAPEVERHLEGEKAVELMPWFWASVKANPHNVEAWTTALYMADRVIKNAKLATAILADAKAANPRSMDIALAEGRFLYRGGKGDLAAAETAFANARRLGLDSCGSDVSGLSGHDADVFLNILDYLSAIAAKRGDTKDLAGYLAESKKIDPESFASKNIAKRISALESSADIR